MLRHFKERCLRIRAVYCLLGFMVSAAFILTNNDRNLYYVRLAVSPVFALVIPGYLISTALPFKFDIFEKLGIGLVSGTAVFAILSLALSYGGVLNTTYLIISELSFCAFMILVNILRTRQRESI